MCVNIFIIQIEYTANKNRQTLSQPKPWCNDSGVLNLHHGYYTTIMTSRRLFRHNPVSRGTNQPIRKSEFVQCMKFEYNYIPQGGIPDLFTYETPRRGEGKGCRNQAQLDSKIS